MGYSIVLATGGITWCQWAVFMLPYSWDISLISRRDQGANMPNIFYNDVYPIQSTRATQGRDTACVDMWER